MINSNSAHKMHNTKWNIIHGLVCTSACQNCGPLRSVVVFSRSLVVSCGPLWWLYWTTVPSHTSTSWFSTALTLRITDGQPMYVGYMVPSLKLTRWRIGRQCNCRRSWKDATLRCMSCKCKYIHTKYTIVVPSIFFNVISSENLIKPMVYVLLLRFFHFKQLRAINVNKWAWLICRRFCSDENQSAPTNSISPRERGAKRSDGTWEQPDLDEIDLERSRSTSRTHPILSFTSRSLHCNLPICWMHIYVHTNLRGQWFMLAFNYCSPCLIEEAYWWPFNNWIFGLYFPGFCSLS